MMVPSRTSGTRITRSLKMKQCGADESLRHRNYPLPEALCGSSYPLPEVLEGRRVSKLGPVPEWFDRRVVSNHPDEYRESIEGRPIH